MIAFTLCSNNYLPMARILGESILRHHPDCSFVIGLVDDLDPAIDYHSLGPFEILPVREIGIRQLDKMILQYSIIELNTSVKPFYFRFLFNRLDGQPGLSKKVCYFDPDIVVYSSLTGIEQSLDTANILLTPHLLTPLEPDGGPFGEHLFLNYGIYNLGFCGMRWSPGTEQLLNWWSDRLVDQCKAKVEEGLFVDQLWMNYAPIFFDGVMVSPNLCLNVAYWNLHERRLQKTGETWSVNGQSPLVFYHFSSFQMNAPDSLGKYSTRYSLTNRPEMRPLFEAYRSRLIDYGYERFSKIPCAFVELRAMLLTQQRRDYYSKHPFQMLGDYWKSPVRLFTALVRSVFRKRNQTSTVAGRDTR
jgi:hypothetical protein